MNNRQITLTVGAAAGGMLAAAFLQTGVASAAVGADGGAAANADSAAGVSALTPTGDAVGGTVGNAGAISPAADADATPAQADFATDPFGLTPTGEADLTPGAGVPPFFESASGTQTFDFDSSNIAPFLQDVLNLPTGEDAITGSATLDVSNMELFGITNQGISLPEDIELSDDVTLQEGSLFDVTNFGGGFGNVYADLVGEGDTPDQVVDYLITPFGNFDISNLVEPFDLTGLTTLDPSAGLFDLGTDTGTDTGTDVGAGVGADAGAAAGADTGADLAGLLG